MKRKSGPVLERKEFAFKADAVSEDGTFTGYGSVFGNVDSYREIVAPGAFAASLKSIAESGDPLPALWQHNSNEPIGGFDTLAEDDRGLKVAGFLLKDEVVRAKEAYALMKRRIVKGLSIGYYVLKDSYNEKEGVRTLLELELVEISIVTFPANEEAQIDAIKSKLLAGDKPTIREFEELLREKGFSRSDAEHIAVFGFKNWQGRESEANVVHSEALEALKAFSLH